MFLWDRLQPVGFRCAALTQVRQAALRSSQGKKPVLRELSARFELHGIVAAQAADFAHEFLVRPHALVGAERGY
jgi:hypothetical protein